VLRDLAQYYSTAKDKTAATALAAKLLGKGYMALLPVLANGAAGIDSLTTSAQKNGLVLGQDSVDAVKAYGKALKDQEDAQKGLEVQTGLLVLPFKTLITEGLTKVTAWLLSKLPAAIAWCKAKFEEIKPTLLMIWNNILVPLGKFLLNVLIGAFNAISTAIAWCKAKFEEIKPTLLMIWNTILVPLGTFIKDQFVSAWESLRETWAILYKELEPHIPLLKKIGMILLAVVAVVVGVFILALVGVVAVIAVVINIVTKVIAAYTKFRQACIDTAKKVSDFFTGLKDKITKAIGDAGKWLYDAGKAVIQGLLDGLKKVWETCMTWITGIGDWIKQHKGPLDADRKLLVPAGVAIMQGLDDGLRKGWSSVRSTLAGYTASIGATGASVSFSVTGGGAVGAYGGGGAFAGSGGYRSVTIAPGAVQVVFPAGTTASRADVDTTIGRAFTELLDEINRR
jgi:hypothetical protein